LEMKLYMLRKVPLYIIRSYSLTLSNGICHTAIEQDQCVPFWSFSITVWHIPLLSVQWITPDDGQRNCPKHVEFHFQNKFEKLVHLVGFIIRKPSNCFSIPRKSNKSLFSKAFIQPPTQWLPAALSSRVQQPPPWAKMKNVWSYISIPAKPSWRAQGQLYTDLYLPFSSSST
jgi:hypothetical protein